MGAAVEPELADRLSVTVIATRPGQAETEAERTPPPPAAASRGAETRPGESAGAREEGPAFGTGFFEKNQPARPASRFVAPPPDLPSEKKQQLLAQQNGKAYRKPRSKLRQGVLPLEILSKGRFEKSEPTIHHGEDLDVPTYIRRGVPLN